MIDNSVIQIINSETAVSTILSKFSIDFIMDIIDDSIRMRFRPFAPGAINYVSIIEQNMNIAKESNPSFIDMIEQTRYNIYKHIVNTICEHYNLNFFGEDVQDYTPTMMYNLAYLLYDIFISNFTERTINFFVSYINNNKDDLYKLIENDDIIKKTKDISIYGRKLYTDNKIIAIHSNVTLIMDNIAGHDIKFADLLYYLTTTDIANYLLSVIEDKGDIYKYYYAPLITSSLSRAELFTSIRLAMQRIIGDRPVDITQFIEKDI